MQESSLPVLAERLVSVDRLFLDPNNPRFLDLSDEVREIPEERVTEPKVQDKALSRMLDPRYDVKQLKESIRSVGFLKVDRLVVLPLPQNSSFVVVEGNRRLAAVKSLLADDATGEVSLSPEILATLKELAVVAIERAEPEKRAHLARVLQGIRHVARVRDWGPYQQALLIASMIDDGRPPTEISEVLGLPMRRINQLRKGYYALKQMRDDPDFGEYSATKLFSHFDEVFKLPKVRDWMEWDDRTGNFLNEQSRRLFYSLITGEDADGERFAPRLSDPKAVRELGELMDDPIRFRQFIDTPRMALSDAVRGVMTPQRKVDWRAGIAQVVTLMKQIPAVDLLDAKAADLQLLEEVKALSESLTRQARQESK